MNSMKRKSKELLPVCLYGMDGRAYKTMLMFLQGPCKGTAHVVSEADAAIDIIDADTTSAKASLEKCLSRDPLRPIIILSLKALNIENTIYVEKPVKTESMLAAFIGAESSLENKKKVSPSTSKVALKDIKVAPKKDVVTVKVNVKASAPKSQKIEKLSSEKKVYVNHLEQQKTEKHKAALKINEQNFSNFIGIVADVDFSDSNEWSKARYNPKQYYQGYVQSALRLALSKGQVLKLNSGWKPLTILPHSHEVWLDANDKELRAFSGVFVGTQQEAKDNVMSLSRVSPKEDSFSTDMDKFHEINAFLWKVACWTSKGRYPSVIDLSKPLYLTQWPNFTRLVITPHAMRIASLLVSEPQSVKNIIQMLHVKPQYVFIFISAAYATGILRQVETQVAKKMVIKVGGTPAAKPVKKKGLLSRILKKLRG